MDAFLVLARHATHMHARATQNPANKTPHTKAAATRPMWILLVTVSAGAGVGAGVVVSMVDVDSPASIKPHEILSVELWATTALPNTGYDAVRVKSLIVSSIFAAPCALLVYVVFHGSALMPSK